MEIETNSNNKFSFTREQLMQKTTRDQIANLKPKDKNLELRFILLQKENSWHQKNKLKVTRFVAADETASIYVYIYGDAGEFLKAGDICYMSGAYTSLFKNEMILYQGKRGNLYKIGEFFLLYNDDVNVSKKNWVEMVRQDLNRK